MHKDSYTARLILVFATALFASCCMAQQSGYGTIHKNNNDSVSGLVWEKNDTVMMVRTFDGDSIAINNHEIREVVWGTPPVIKPKPKPLPVQETPQETYSWRPPNMIGVNVFELAYLNLALRYERLFAGGYVGFGVPVKLGFGPPTEGGHVYRNRQFSLGGELNFYPTGFKKTCFLAGMFYEYGIYRYRPSPGNSIVVSEPDPIPVSYSIFGTHFGIMKKMAEGFVLGITASVGLRADKQEDYLNYAIPDKANRAVFNLAVTINRRF